jgi:hypothetical protein
MAWPTCPTMGGPAPAPAPPGSTPAPAPAPAPEPVNTCDSADNGSCEEGSGCAAGTDCNDCNTCPTEGDSTADPSIAANAAKSDEFMMSYPEGACGKPHRTTSFAPFDTKNASFYQDRLGTNIGKAALKQAGVFLPQVRRREACPRDTATSTLSGRQA